VRVKVFIAAMAATLFGAAATAQEQPQSFSPEQIKTGAELYATNCSPCHGPRMQGAESAFDLRTFPHDQRERFFNSVRRGKNQMPPWGDLFNAEQLAALWAYVATGERN
jgi:mono/diheme cytochrome c family protein